MRFNTVSNINEFYALFFRGGAPALEPPFIELTDNLIQQVVIIIPTVGSTRIRILWVNFCLTIIQPYAVIKFYPL